MGEKSSSLTFMQMKGMKEEREDGAEINIEKHNLFFLKFMLIRFIDTRNLSNANWRNLKKIRFKYTKFKFMKTFN